MFDQDNDEESEFEDEESDSDMIFRSQTIANGNDIKFNNQQLQIDDSKPQAYFSNYTKYKQKNEDID